MASVSIHNKSPYYMAHYTVNGKLKQRSTKIPIAGGMVPGGMYKGVFIKKSAAKGKAQEVANEMEKVARGLTPVAIAIQNAGVDIRQELPSIRSFLEHHEEDVKGRLAVATYRNTKVAVQRLLDYLGDASDKPIDTLKIGALREWVKTLSRDYRSGTIRNYLASLSPAFEEAARSEILVRNPFDGVKPPPERPGDKLRRDPFSLDDIRKLIRELPPEWSSAVRCSYELGGQRLGDILALKWENVDFLRGIVAISTEKTGRHMVIPLKSSFRQWLESEHAARSPKPKDYLHPNLACRRSRNNALSTEFSTIVRLLGITDYEPRQHAGKRRNMSNKTFHSIRATVATLLHLHAVDPSIARAIVGHDSAAIHEVYVKPNLDQLLANMERLDPLDLPTYHAAGN